MNLPKLKSDVTEPKETHEEIQLKRGNEPRMNWHYGGWL